jgi:hypothetical protein
MSGPKRITGIIGSALLGAFLAMPASAQVNAGMSPIASAISLGTADIRVIVANVINVGLTILGTILLVIILYAGFLWMTAGGDDEKITRAKRLIMNGVIGLAIVLASYAITYFVVTRLMGVRDSNSIGGPGNEQAVTAGFGDWGTASLGEGIVQSHYPAPGASGVPRNTKMIVTFKLPIDPTTLISDGSMRTSGNNSNIYTGMMNQANARLIASADLPSGGIFQASSDKLVADIAAYTVDNRTFVFAPARFLGSPSSDVSYTMAFGSGVKLGDGGPAFYGNYASGYRWEFATGTNVDATPPKVVSVMPSPGSAVARNALIEITFDEAVDPTSATGVFSEESMSFSNVAVHADGVRVNGTWEPANQYRTIGFRSMVRAGNNSCGDPVFVLPGGASITVSALAATVGDAPPAASFYPPDGVTDLASNSLDGNGDGKAEGPAADTLRWSFNTSNILDLTPPRVDSTDPSPESGNADLSKPVTLTFSKPLALTTLNNKNLVFDTAPKIPLWYMGSGVNLGSDGQPVGSIEQRVVRTNAVIDHERLAPTVGRCSDGVRKNEQCAIDADCPAGVCVKTAFNYYPKATSGVTDIYQNCFLPACGADPDRRFCCPTALGDISCRTECAVSGSGQLFCDEAK